MTCNQIQEQQQNRLWKGTNTGTDLRNPGGTTERKCYICGQVGHFKKQCLQL